MSACRAEPGRVAEMTRSRTWRFWRPAEAVQYLLGGIGLAGNARKQAKALRRSEACLTEAQRLSRTGGFSWSVRSGEILWSEETFRIFEYDRTTEPTLERVLRRVHPEDAARVKGILERASRDGGNFDFEHRLLMPDGSVKHVHVAAHGMSDESGNLEFVGAAMDVTAAKETEQRLKCSEAYLHEAQRLAHMGSSVRNVSSGDFIPSPEFQRIFGFDPDKEKPTFEMFRDRIHPDDILGVVEIVDKARREKRDYEADFSLLALSTISRSEEHTSELQSLTNLVCRLLLEKKKKRQVTTGCS